MKHHIYTFIGLLAISTFLFPLGMKADTTSGLVGWWTMDWNSYLSPITMVDSSGNGNTGTLTNMSQSASPVEGKMGQALQFISANNQYVLTPSIDLTSTPVVTISFWADFSSNSYSSIQGITELWGASGSGNIFYAERDDTNLTDGCASSGQIDVGEADVTFDNYFSQCFPVGTLNSWHHYVLELDITNQTAVEYLDGVSQTGNAYVIKGSSSGDFGTWPLTIASEYSGSSYDHLPFDGKIDDFRVYNRALSAQDVYQLYQTTAYNYIMPRGY